MDMEPAGPFPRGVTEVTITVTDEHGTFDLCTATITVNAVASVEETGVPRATGIVGVVPNPFNPKTTVSFYVPEGGHVDVAVYDISGRMVARLVDTSVVAGEHSVEWNGTDTRGSRVTSGVYFFRMRAGSVVDVKRGILVK
jgi:flagellar hook assembly protein FlgD